MKSLIKYLYRIKPELFWEIATEDMIGTIPKKVTEPSLNFLKSAGRDWESFLIWISWKNQVRSMSDVKNERAYVGMLFLIRWLYHLATKSPIKEVPRSEPTVLREEVDPFEGVRDFVKGKITKK